MLQDWYVIREDEMSRRQAIVSHSQMRGRTKVLQFGIKKSLSQLLFLGESELPV